MNDQDRLEDLLRVPGPREADYLPRRLPSALDRPHRGFEGRGWTLLRVGRLAALSAAVVAGTAVAVVLVGGGGSPAGSGTAATSASATASAPAPASSEVATVAATPTSSPASAAPPACRAADLAWSTDAWGGAAGSTGTTVLARGLTSLDRCTIDGSATLELRDANGNVVATATAPRTTVVVTPGAVIEMGIHWSNWCQATPAAPLSMSLRLPGDGTDVALAPAAGGILVPPCNGPGQPSSLGATAFAASSRPMPGG